MKMIPQDNFGKLYDESDNSEKRVVPISIINDDIALERLRKEIIERTYQIENYARGTIDYLRNQGIDAEIKTSSNVTVNQIEIRITINVKGISEEYAEELREIAERERYLREIKGKPRGIHAKRE